MTHLDGISMLRPPKLVLFDLDDTLCDHDSSLRMRLRRAFGAALEGHTSADLDVVVEESIRRSVGGTDHFADVLAGVGMTDAERCRSAIEIYVSDRYLGLELFEESLDVVQTISRYATVGLVTNGPSTIQRDKIVRLDIGHLFPFILVSEEEGVWKPDPEIFWRALALGGVEPHEAVFVGDSPDHDIAGANAAGLTTIWINRRGREWPAGSPPHYEVRDLRELLPLLNFPE